MPSEFPLFRTDTVKEMTERDILKCHLLLAKLKTAGVPARELWVPLLIKDTLCCIDP